MRIISGKYRGKVLKTFSGQDIRPTSDRAKEALFNILNQKVVNGEVLDLFCGTGSIGVECISRGAKKVVFVDNSPESIAITKANVSSIRESGEIVLASADRFLSNYKAPFDIIFLDPPYKYDNAKLLFEKIYENKLLKDDGIIIYEHKSDRVSEEYDNFNLYSTRKYGIAVFDFYKVDKV